MIRKITLWYYRNFSILSENKAITLNLYWVSNVYGDAINKMNCRSIWKDSKNRIYRVHNLK